ncbi:lysozyme inhibitor LprI family protein [Anaerosporobacter sp.]|uniref:lysozyme inhibitor LprI family protein n=1 Tax=Anaerosporobacter sp. TaxID=1872529 RepID=UPI00286F686F|nr:lysozyme inhibitor LprI family protein [Anaerosporobacter sp.]
MKKNIIGLISVLLIVSLTACGNKQDASELVTQNVQTNQEAMESKLENEVVTEDASEQQEENQGVNENSEITSEEFTNNNGKEVVIGLKDTIKIDFTYDYTEDIKADVAYVVSNSSSLQEELKNIDTIIQKYTLLAESAQTQGEMNVASQWLYVIWDTELNNLWSRFSSLAEKNTKEMVLEEQRNWIAMKEEITLMSIGSQEENGSMYPMLVNSLWEENTKNRAYFIANELAQIKGESFVMPKGSTKYGLFVDNQGTGSVYSSLITRQSWEGEDEAIISVYRQGEIEGSFSDNGNGNLDFTSNDGSIKGTIQINGWDGATFEVTETIGAVPFSVGEKFEFPVAF